MGNKESKVSADNVELKTVFGTCSLGKCGSSCCADGPAKTNDKEQQAVHDVKMILRYGKTMTDHEIVKAVRGIVGDDSPKRIPTLKELFPPELTKEKEKPAEAISVKAAIENKE